MLAYWPRWSNALVVNGTGVDNYVVCWLIRAYPSLTQSASKGLHSHATDLVDEKSSSTYYWVDAFPVDQSTASKWTKGFGWIWRLFIHLHTDHALVQGKCKNNTKDVKNLLNSKHKYVYTIGISHPNKWLQHDAAISQCGGTFRRNLWTRNYVHTLTFSSELQTLAEIVKSINEWNSNTGETWIRSFLSKQDKYNTAKLPITVFLWSVQMMHNPAQKHLTSLLTTVTNGSTRLRTFKTSSI